MARALVAALMLLAFAACNQVLGIEPYPQAAFVDPECGACIDAQCAAEADACSADQACASLFACVASCAASDYDCRDRCEEAHASAKLESTWQAYASCEESRCAASCVPPLFVDAPCAACVDESCDDLRDRCEANPDCAPLFRCMARCPVDDWRCRAACEKDHPQGVPSPAFEAYDGCRRYLCLDACIGTTLPPYYDKPGCAECIAGNCEPEARTCLAMADCERFFACIQDSEDPSRTISCFHRVYPGMWPGDTPPDSVAYCWQACAKECGIGENWDCVGSWSLETLSGPSPSLELLVLPWLGGNAIEGVTIDVCSEGVSPGEDCTESVHATTDAAGYAQLFVPREDGLRFNGHLRLGGAVLTEYWYPFWPVVHDTFWPIWAMPDIAYLERVYAGIASEFVANPNLGHILMYVNDCKLIGGAAGAFVDVDGKVEGQTAIGYRFSTPEQGTTADSEIAVIGNVEQGHRTIVAKLKDGTEVARRKVWVGANAFTVASLLPLAEDQ